MHPAYPNRHQQRARHDPMLNPVPVHPAQPPTAEPLFLLRQRRFLPSFQDGAEARVAVVSRPVRKPVVDERRRDRSRRRWRGRA